MEHRGFLLALDLGQAADYSALAIIERWRETGADASGGELGLQLARERRRTATAPHVPISKRKRLYHLRHLQRWKLGTSYVSIVQDVRDLLNRPELRGSSRLLIDRTGVGRAVFDLFDALDVEVHGVTITSGNRHHSQPGGWTVPKADLVGAVQACLGTGRLRFAAELPNRDLLRTELGNFEARVSNTGHLQLAADWRSGDHDDLVLALAIGLWYAETMGANELDAGDWRPIKK